MPIQVQGPSGTAAQVEVNTQAIRMRVSPVDVTSNGSFLTTAVSGTIAAATFNSAACCFSARNTSATIYMILRRLAVGMNSLGTGYTAGVGRFDMYLARTFSGTDSGGTTLTLTGNNAKKKTGFATSILSTQVFVSSTGVVTAGTRTLDTQAQISLIYGVTATTNSVMLATTDMLPRDPGNNYPLTIAQNEGIVLNATLPATGTGNIFVTMEWDEVTASGSGF